MKKILFLGIVPLAAVFLAQCAAGPQKWPDYERRAEARMMLLKERIGEGLRSNALSTSEAHSYLARLEAAQRDYVVLRDKLAYREEWETFLRRLDQMEAEVNRDLARPVRIVPPPVVVEPPPVRVEPPLEAPRIEDRISALQRRIDDARAAGRLTPGEGRDFQARLEAIRGDYSRWITGRTITYEERTETWRRLDLLEADLNRIR
jgi:hypothetical protein